MTETKNPTREKILAAIDEQCQDERCESGDTRLWTCAADDMDDGTIYEPAVDDSQGVCPKCQGKAWTGETLELPEVQCESCGHIFTIAR